MEILKEFQAQVLVRFTPNDEVPLGNFIPNERFYIDRPGHQFQKGVYRDQELGKKDLEWLADCLYYADVVVAGGASIGIDAAIFGKPTILIHFDGYQTKPYQSSVKRFLEYNHPAAIIESGAMRSAQSLEQFQDYLRDYLENPKKDELARKKMIDDYCWQLDGHSGERIGQYIIKETGVIKEIKHD
jgi:CDP-glycerol glycerophosphotransferase (TagB/SpsB family)